MEEPMPGEDRTLFAEDSAAHQVAASLGFVLTRKFRGIEITDDAALKAAGFTSTRPKPDYAAISKALDAGKDVPGARWRGQEYLLRPAGGAEC
jgi:hypothetical protein